MAQNRVLKHTEESVINNDTPGNTDHMCLLAAAQNVRLSYISGPCEYTISLTCCEIYSSLVVVAYELFVFLDGMHNQKT